MINIEEKEEKHKKCDACSVQFDKLYYISFGHNPNRQSVAKFCFGCVYDLKDKLYIMFGKEQGENSE